MKNPVVGLTGGAPLSILAQRGTKPACNLSVDLRENLGKSTNEKSPKIRRSIREKLQHIACRKSQKIYQI